MLAEKSVNVTVGDGVVTIKRSGSSKTTVACSLGTVIRGTTEIICLDRLVHEPHEDRFVGWNVSGAVTTLLSRTVDPTTTAQ